MHFLLHPQNDLIVEDVHVDEEVNISLTFPALMPPLTI
jgi:hypothetical protein